MIVKDFLQILLLILGKLKRKVLFPLKSSKNRMFSDDFKGNKS